MEALEAWRPWRPGGLGGLGGLEALEAWRPGGLGGLEALEAWKKGFRLFVHPCERPFITLFKKGLKGWLTRSGRVKWGQFGSDWVRYRYRLC